MNTFKTIFIGSRGELSGTADLGRALLRIFAGLALAFGHGLGKIPPSEGFIGGVTELGFPIAVFFAWASGLTEFVGGLLLAAGLFTRPASLLITINMAVAGFLRHADDPFSGKEKALLFLAVAVMYLLAGAGRYSLDALIRRRNRSSLIKPTRSA